MKSYVMSIRKDYGMNLLEGKSSWEYRRRKSRISRGDRIILYSTAPDSRLIGEFIVGDIVTGNPEEVWEKTKENVCYSKEEVVPYLKTGNFPIAFQVTQPRIYENLAKLRDIPNFRPPMSYCVASLEILSLIESL